MQYFHFSQLYDLAKGYGCRSTFPPVFRSVMRLLCIAVLPAFGLDTLSAQCTVTISNCPELPVTIVDCDHNGVETIDWPTIIANPGGGCTGFTLMQTSGPLPGTVVPMGVYNIGYLAQAHGAGEGGGLVSAPCNFLVQVMPDVVPPVITNCPPDITVYASEGGSSQGMWPLPGVTDNCSGVVLTSNHPCGEIFPPGVTTVEYTATDASGNTTTCTFTVTVLGSVERTAATKHKGPVTSLSLLGMPKNQSTAGDRQKASVIVPLEIAVLPNPFTDRLQLNAGNVLETALTVRVYDLTGRMLATADWQAGVSTFSMHSADWAPGIYLVKIYESSRPAQVFMGVKM